MIQGEKSVNIYKLNNNTVVEVKGEKIADGAYKYKVAVKAEVYRKQPFAPNTKSDVISTVKELDLEDDQISLLGDDPNQTSITEGPAK